MVHVRYFNTALANNKEETELHIKKKQSENYFTVKQQPFQIYITLNSCKM